MTTLDLPEDVLDRLDALAHRSHGGDRVAALSAALGAWQTLGDPLGLLPPGSVPSGPTTALVASLLQAGGVSADDLGRFADLARSVADGTEDARSSLVADHLRPVVAWVSERPTERALWASVVTSQPGHGDAGTQRPGVVSQAVGFVEQRGPSLRGSLTQTFSDRESDGRGFDPARADRLGLELTVAPDGSGFVEVALVAESWGGGRSTLQDLTVVGGVLVGAGPAVGQTAPAASYAVSLARSAIPG